MPRRPRVHLDGLPLHIVQRGHNRQPCFFCEADYQRYLHWLEEALAQARCELHADVLMTNHVHLLVTPQAAQRVPGVLISLGRRYVQHVNRVYRRTGTLWDRLALNQGQPTGDSQFHAAIEAALGRRCEARPRGRPRATGN